MSDSTDHIDWILRHGRFLDMQGLADGLGSRLRDSSMPLMRLRMGMRTTHPLIAAVSYIWDPSGSDADNPTQQSAEHGLETRSTYVGSPMEIVVSTQAPYRRRLDGDLGPDDHLILHELKARGATDWYGRPLVFATGSGGIIIFVAEGRGFDAGDIALLDTLCDVIAPVAEARQYEHLATAIAESYLGQRTGQRVLSGQITRGDIETIEAAILFSDLRGWTALNATRAPSETLGIANGYFEVISDAVDNNDGEILKFMGDGVLALFPGDGTADGRTRACRNAISAAHAAHGIATLAAFDIPFGIGIHYGEVLYGNIGARARIDFTVLGQAVNTAARIEACCGLRDEPVLVSDIVADHAGTALRRVGTETLKGIAEPMALYAPASS